MKRYFKNLTVNINVETESVKKPSIFRKLLADKKEEYLEYLNNMSPKGKKAFIKELKNMPMNLHRKYGDIPPQLIAKCKV